VLLDPKFAGGTFVGDLFINADLDESCDEFIKIAHVETTAIATTRTLIDKMA